MNTFRIFSIIACLFITLSFIGCEKEALQELPTDTTLEINQIAERGKGDIAPPPLVKCKPQSKCGINLVENGDFSAGDVGFTSSLNSVQGCQYGTYWVDYSSRDKCMNSLWQNIVPASATGNYMIIDGKNGTIWEQNIAVDQGTTYDWTFQLYPNISGSGGPTLAVRINGNIVASGIQGQAKYWKEFCGSYTIPMGTTNVAFEIIQTGSTGYNDYGIDEIKLLTCCDGTNLVPNGDFEAGNVNFTSDLPFNNNCAAQTYSVEYNAKDKCNSSLWDPILPSGGENYMVIDGFYRLGSANTVYRNQVNIVSAVPHYLAFDYYPNISNGSTPNLGVYLNGTLVGSTTGNAGTWTTYVFAYSGTGLTDIEIKQLSVGTYDDYGIDNVVLTCDKGGITHTGEPGMD